MTRRIAKRCLRPWQTRSKLDPGRGSIRWADPLIEITADVHGQIDGPVRDAVLREVFLSG